MTRVRSLWLLPIALIVIAAIVWLRRHEPSYAERIAPVTIPGEVGKRVAARNFAVTVVPGYMRFAQTLRAPGDDLFGDGKPIELHTSGVWVAVPATIESLRETGFVSAQLRTRDGLYYDNNPDDRPKARVTNLNTRFVAPGLPETGYYFFEVPRDRLQGLHLQLFWGGLAPSSNDALVDIDLRIDAAHAQRLAQTTLQPMVVAR